MQNGVVDIGGYNSGFEPSKLPLHAFQAMLPFGTMDPTVSLAIAQDVYKAVPYFTEVFEKKYNQKLLARIADGGYNLGTAFDWNKVSDLKGIKIAGAGLNLNWLKYAGATPVQGSLPEAYTGMQTHVYEGWVMFPSAWVNLKLYEPGPVLYADRVRLNHLACADDQQGHMEPPARRRQADSAGGCARLRAEDRDQQQGTV